MKVRSSEYATIHKTIHSKYGKATKCENSSCSGKARRFEWSNIDHKHNLDKKDWKMLCQICHVAFDRLHNGKYSSSTRYERRQKTKALTFRYCIQCGNKFMPHIFNQKQRFCSQKCSCHNWYLNNKEKVRLLSNKWIEKHKERYREARKISQRKYMKKLRERRKEL